MWRTIAQACDEIKRIDPGTAITKHTIRSLAQQERIEILKVQSKVLVNFKALCEQLKIEITN